jgi:hypothetical protein
LILRQDKNDQSMVRRLQENPASCNMRVLELIWLFDDFALRSYEVRFDVVHLEGFMAEFTETRKDIFSGLFSRVDSDPSEHLS